MCIDCLVIVGMDDASSATRKLYEGHVSQWESVSWTQWTQLRRAVWLHTKHAKNGQDEVKDKRCGCADVKAAFCTTDGTEMPPSGVRDRIRRFHGLRLAQPDGHIITSDNCTGAMPPDMGTWRVVDEDGNALLPKELWAYVFARAAINVCASPNHRNNTSYDAADVILLLRRTGIAVKDRLTATFPSIGKVKEVLSEGGAAPTLARALAVAHAEYNHLMASNMQGLLTEYAPLLKRWTPMFCDRDTMSRTIDGSGNNRSIVVHRDAVHSFLKGYTYFQRVRILLHETASSHGCYVATYTCAFRHQYRQTSGTHSGAIGGVVSMSSPAAGPSDAAGDCSSQHDADDIVRSSDEDESDSGEDERGVDTGTEKGSSAASTVPMDCEPFASSSSTSSALIGDVSNVGSTSHCMDCEECPDDGPEACAVGGIVGPTASTQHPACATVAASELAAATSRLYKQKQAKKRKVMNQDCRFRVLVIHLLSEVVPWTLICFQGRHTSHVPGRAKDEWHLGYHASALQFLQPSLTQPVMPTSVLGDWRVHTEEVRRAYSTALLGSVVRGVGSPSETSAALESLHLPPSSNNPALDCVGFSPPRHPRMATRETGKRVRADDEAPMAVQAITTQKQCRCNMPIARSSASDDTGVLLACAMGDLCAGAGIYHRGCLSEPEQAVALQSGGWLCPECILHQVPSAQSHSNDSTRSDDTLERCVTEMARDFLQVASACQDDVSADLMRAMAVAITGSRRTLIASNLESLPRVRPRSMTDSARRDPTLEMHDASAAEADTSATRTSRGGRRSAVDYAAMAAADTRVQSDISDSKCSLAADNSAAPSSAWDWDFSRMAPKCFKTMDHMHPVMRRNAQRCPPSYSGYRWVGSQRFLRNRRTKVLRDARNGLRNDDSFFTTLRKLKNAGWARVEAAFDETFPDRQPLRSLRAVIIAPRQVCARPSRMHVSAVGTWKMVD